MGASLIRGQNGIHGFRSSLRRMGGNRGSAEFSPLDLSPLAWYRSDLGISKIGSLVTQWADQSGNGYHLTAGAGVWPTYTASNASFNGFPSIDTNGTNTYLTSSPSTFSIAGDFTVFCVLKVKEVGLGAFWELRGGNSIFLFADQTRVGTSAGTSQYNLNVPWIIGDVITARVQCSNSHATHKVFSNAAEKALSAVDTGNPTASDNRIFNLGVHGGVFYGEHDFAELIIFSPALSAGNAAIVESYLQTRYAHY